MTRLLRRLPSLSLAVLLLAAAAPAARALDPDAWRYRQPLDVPQPGLVKLALPPETVGLARPGLDDLRLLDPSGNEVPYVVTVPAPSVPPAVRAPVSFRNNLRADTTELWLETGTGAPLEAVTFSTAAYHFLKSARLEISRNGSDWETLADATAIFREFGTERLRFPLDRRTAAYLRLVVDDSRSRPVPFTGALLELAGTAAADPTESIPVRLVRREEFAGETVLTVDFGGANVPLASLGFATPDSLFARPITLTTRELRDDHTEERSLATGSIWRVSGDGVRSAAQLDVPVRLTTPARELFVHIANGDSPPLGLDRLTARQRPIWLVFRAATPGAYTFLAGNAQVPAARYDLSSLAVALRDTPPSGLVPGPSAVNPRFHATDALADAPLFAAALDPRPWRFHRAVQLNGTGVQELELGLDVLARAQSDLRDLRLVHEGTQVPFILERTALSYKYPVAFANASDPKQPSLSRWRLPLPYARPPITRLIVTSPTPVFQRQLRLYEILPADRNGESRERVIEVVTWTHTPSAAGPLTIDLPALVSENLYLETDNGDNPPIALGGVQGLYPVVRLFFRGVPGPVALYYGNAQAYAPRYDLALVAPQILAAEKLPASLAPVETTAVSDESSSTIAGLSTGVVFWSALALVVIALLVIVARLLPKPPQA